MNQANLSDLIAVTGLVILPMSIRSKLSLIGDFLSRVTMKFDR